LGLGHRRASHLGLVTARSLGWSVLATAVMVGCTGPAHTEMSERARDFLESSDFRWQTIESRSARIHYLEDSYAGGDPEALVERVEAARGEVLRKLAISEYRPTLDVFYVESRADMERLTGYPVTGMSYTRDHTVVLVFSETWRAFERHEIAHVISRSVWGEPGPPEAPALEGLAVFVDGDCGGYPVSRVVRAVYDRGLLLDLDRLFGSFRAEDDLVAYLEAASLFDFITAHGGIEAVREVWEEGLAAAPGWLGLDRSEFERRWLSELESRWEPVPDGAWRRIRADGCGIDARSASLARVRAFDVLAGISMP
jgi:hypothetical protein